MKYGESAFDILYLVFAITAGIVILKKARDKGERLMGAAALILGLGDAFHLVPRVLNYFLNADLSVALGIGKLVTSVTMTVFYVLLYHIWVDYYQVKNSGNTVFAVWLLAALRVVLCLFPQNGWFQNSSPLLWSILRNIPFAALGAVVCVLYFLKRKVTKRFSRIWLYILLSFAFYLPVAIGAGYVPILGMLMLPKTICYILLILTFMYPY